MPEKKKTARERWVFLDGIFRRGVPVSTDEIFRELRQNGFSIPGARAVGLTEDDRLRNEFGNVFRQDIRTIRELYNQGGNSGDPFPCERDSRDGRKRLYRYKDSGFSIVPILESRLTDAEYNSLQSAFRIMEKNLPPELFAQVEFLAKSRIEYQNGKNPYVDYSDNTRLTGFNLLPVLYHHLKYGNAIRLRFSLQPGETDEFVFHPNLLKRYRDRWYCFGFREDLKEWWPIAVDRIEGGSIEEAGKKAVKYEDVVGRPVSDNFKDIVGVTYNVGRELKGAYRLGNAPADISFKITDAAAWQRFTSCPIHHSLRITEPFDARCNCGRAVVHVKPNIEFYMAVLSFGENIAIESPAAVRNEMKEILGLMAGQYE